MRTSEQRIAKYNARYQSSLVDPVLTAVVELQKANFEAYVNEFVPKQEALRALLAGYGIPTIGYWGYEAYNHECYHLWLTASGDSAIATAEALVDKYAAWGLVEANLRAILASIWNIVTGAPSP